MGDTFNQSHSGSGHNIVNIGSREPNVLYQDGRKVATVVNGRHTDNPDEVVFAEIRFSDSADTTRPFEFQNAKIMCHTPSVVSDAAIFLSLHDNVRCTVVGPR